MIDQLRQMAIFAKTIDHGSFRGAARELRLSPSVVSHHISQLEEHLGVALIYRSTRKLRLTREGQRLLHAVRKMLEAVEGELLELSVTAGEPSGELRLTMPSVLSQSHLINQIASFSMTYPRIRLSLDFSDIRKDLIDERFDIAIRMGLKKKRSASSRKLFQINRKVVASINYLAKQPKINEPKQLVDCDWLELSQLHSVPLSLRKSNSQKVTIKRAAHMYSNDALALYRLARADAGLAAVPEFLATEDVEAGLVEIVLPDWKLDPVDVYAEWPANAPKAGLIKLLIAELSGKRS